MIDTRENILARLAVIIGTVPNIKFTDRNNSEVDERQLPALVVFDGDEESNSAADISTHLPSTPSIIRMHPIIEIATMSATASSDLSVLRRELIRLVLYDAELNNNIVRTGRNGNGAIRYMGCQTDPTWMRNLDGQMRIQFMFAYSLNPADL
jgi:hypothetical protein